MARVWQTVPVQAVQFWSLADNSVSPRQYDVIAGFFGQSRERTFQPPGNRMEPEESTVQQSKPLHEGIAPADVLSLMRQYGVELRGRPFSPVIWKNHRWMEETHSHRRGAKGTDAHAVLESRVTDERACAVGA
jgi:hypothetical protein